MMSRWRFVKHRRTWFDGYADDGCAGRFADGRGGECDAVRLVARVCRGIAAAARAFRARCVRRLARLVRGLVRCGDGGRGGRDGGSATRALGDGRWVAVWCELRGRFGGGGGHGGGRVGGGVDRTRRSVEMMWLTGCGPCAGDYGKTGGMAVKAW